MFLTRSEYGTHSFIEYDFHFYISGSLDRGVNTFSPEGRLFQGEFFICFRQEVILTTVQWSMLSRPLKYIFC